MASESKCEGGLCPIKGSCKRFLSKSSMWQSYLTDTPFKHVGNMFQYISCDFFIKHYNE